MKRDEAISVLLDLIPPPLTEADETTSTQHGKIVDAIALAVSDMELQNCKIVIVDDRKWTCPACGSDLDFNNRSVCRCRCGQYLWWE